MLKEYHQKVIATLSYLQQQTLLIYYWLIVNYREPFSSLVEALAIGFVYVCRPACTRDLFDFLFLFTYLLFSKCLKPKSEFWYAE